MIVDGHPCSLIGGDVASVDTSDLNAWPAHRLDCPIISATECSDIYGEVVHEDTYTQTI